MDLVRGLWRCLPLLLLAAIMWWSSDLLAKLLNVARVASAPAEHGTTTSTGGEPGFAGSTAEVEEIAAARQGYVEALVEVEGEAIDAVADLGNDLSPTSWLPGLVETLTSREVLVAVASVVLIVWLVRAWRHRKLVRFLEATAGRRHRIEHRMARALAATPMPAPSPVARLTPDRPPVKEEKPALMSMWITPEQGVPPWLDRPVPGAPAPRPSPGAARRRDSSPVGRDLGAPGAVAPASPATPSPSPPPPPTSALQAKLTEAGAVLASHLATQLALEGLEPSPSRMAKLMRQAEEAVLRDLRADPARFGDADAYAIAALVAAAMGKLVAESSGYGKDPRVDAVAEALTQVIRVLEDGPESSWASNTIEGFVLGHAGERVASEESQDFATRHGPMGKVFHALSDRPFRARRSPLPETTHDGDEEGPELCPAEPAAMDAEVTGTFLDRVLAQRRARAAGEEGE